MVFRPLRFKLSLICKKSFGWMVPVGSSERSKVLLTPPDSVRAFAKVNVPATDTPPGRIVLAGRAVISPTTEPVPAKICPPRRAAPGTAEISRVPVPFTLI